MLKHNMMRITRIRPFYALNHQAAPTTHATQCRTYASTPAPKGLKYTKDHEWIKLTSATTATMGITDHAQNLLGDIVYLESPTPGKTYAKHGISKTLNTYPLDVMGAVESVKAASDVYAPMSGTVVSINAELETEPALVNSDPYGRGWIAIIEISEAGQVEGMMDEDAYAKLVKE